jgi:hypothetical protein
MKKLLLASVLAIASTTAMALDYRPQYDTRPWGAAEPPSESSADSLYCTLLCAQEVPRGQENAELTKPINGRCTIACNTQAGCEWILQNAKKHKLRTDGQCKKDE